jgi:RNA polymerase sigma-B factor
VLINRCVADAVAARYRNRGIPGDDLQQVAYVGLTKAVQRFDPRSGNDLLTFAVPTIRGELQRYFRDQGWTVRPPRRVQELQWRMNLTIEELEHQLGREPERGEVRAALGLTEQEYDDALSAFGCFHLGSLDQPAGSGTTAVGDLIAGKQDQLGGTEARIVLSPVVRRLPHRDRRILYLRFFEDRTQAEIGEEIGVTQMQVSRLLSRILRDLRAAIEDRAAGTL